MRVQFSILLRRTGITVSFIVLCSGIGYTAKLRIFNDKSMLTRRGFAAVDDRHTVVQLAHRVIRLARHNRVKLFPLVETHQ